jgi:Terminase large subunit, T4likevirus-type, N-terminal
MEPFYLQPRQWEFCTSPADIVVFGGSVGGGKTRALVYEPIARSLYKNPGFTDVIFRETFPEIMELGGPWQEACDVYPWFGAKMVVGAHETRFPSGAVSAFRYLDNEETKFKYKGSQFCRIAFDELTHFSESRVRYMFSRNRSACGIVPYMRATTNPDIGWVKTRFLAPWVDREYPGKPAKSGELRWLKYNSTDDPEWFETPVDGAKSITFIRSRLEDNPALLAANPGYLDTLQMLTPIEKERLLNGNWDVRREGLVYPDFEQCIVDPHTSEAAAQALRVPPTEGGIDYGFNNPFAALWGHVDHDDIMWVTGCRYKRETTLPIHAEALPRGVHWWCDPEGKESTVQLRQMGHNCTPCSHISSKGSGGETKKPKLSGIDHVSHRMRSGRFRIVRTPETMPFIRELGIYHYAEDKHTEEPVDEDNHACDAGRYWAVGRDRGRVTMRMLPMENPIQREAREKAEARTEWEKRRDLDRQAQANPDDPRWWNE